MYITYNINLTKRLFNVDYTCFSYSCMTIK